ncbi:MAG: bacillithiol biosynthesis deacetylase BshB1, partial [Candidatus Aminicenantales bacterium]
MDLDALAFGAHADDVELGCGGTLIKLAAAGHRTGVVALTRGEMASRGSASVRAREFEDSAALLGLAAHEMLDIPDARVDVSRENTLKLVERIRAYRPRIVFAPYWIDRHPDHEKTSQLVREAFFLAALKKIETGQPPVRPHKLIFYPTRFDFTPSFIVDVSAHHERKMRAIRAYRSQFGAADGEAPDGPETLISRPAFLDRIEGRARQFGAQIGVLHGEPFLVREAIQVD